MQLTGDPAGIEAFKRLKENNKDYLKFVITAARTETNRTADFKAEDGTTYLVIYHPQKDELEISKKP